MLKRAKEFIDEVLNPEEFSQIYLENFNKTLLVLALFENPSDYPYEYVLRIFEYEHPLVYIYKSILLSDIDKLTDSLNLFRIPRSQEDDPNILATYI